MEKAINKSFNEVYEIILNMEDEMYNKIPEKFIEMIENNRDLRI